MLTDDYAEMAEKLGVTRCRGIESTGHYCPETHDLTGSVTPGVVHFSHRGQASKVTTRVFLRLVARMQDPTIDSDEPWRRAYRLTVAVRQLAATLHIKDPGARAMDRSFVLASVAGMPNSVPMRKQAFDWARRGPKKEIDHAR